MNEYEQIKSILMTGWNTWNTRSVLSHVLLQSGIAVNLGVKEYTSGAYLKESLIGRLESWAEQVIPGMRTYDGSYTELTLCWKQIELHIQTGTQDGEWVCLVQPISVPVSAPTLVVESGILWNRPGSLMKDGDSLVFQQPGQGSIRIYATESSIPEVNVACQTPYLALPLSHAVGLSSGRPRTIEEIQTILSENRAKHEMRIRAYGEQSDVYQAMQTSLAWDTIYDAANHRIVTPVSRIWNCNNGGYALFCWDNYFAAYMAALDNKPLAYANAIEMTREATEHGFVPNCAWGTGFKSRDRSQPPVGSLVVRELYRKYREPWIVEALFDALLEWNRWWVQNRLNGPLLSWGSTPYEVQYGNYWETAGVNDTFGGALESGLDNSPMYDDVPFDPDRHFMKLHDVGLNGLYGMDCEALADLAKVLGRAEEEAELRQRGEQIRAALAELWEDSFGLYLNRRTDTGAWSYRLSPTNFYALLASAPSQEQAQRMTDEHLFNPEEFWGDWVLPSIARNDVAFSDQNYWRGRIWAPMNFLVYLGLKRYNLPTAQTSLAKKSVDLLMKEWRAHGHVHENYNAMTGEGCDKANSDRFYHWGALLGTIALIEAGAYENPWVPLD